MNLPSKPFNPQDWRLHTRPRLVVDKETGEVYVSAGFRHKITGKVKEWRREATLEEIETGHPVQ
jgi:hypothetical protein